MRTHSRRGLSLLVVAFLCGCSNPVATPLTDQSAATPPSSSRAATTTAPEPERSTDESEATTSVPPASSVPVTVPAASAIAPGIDLSTLTPDPTHLVGPPLIVTDDLWVVPLSVAPVGVLPSSLLIAVRPDTAEVLWSQQSPARTVRECTVAGTELLCLDSLRDDPTVEAAIVRVDPSTGEELSRVQTSPSTGVLLWDPTGGRVIVRGDGGGGATALDTATGAVTWTNSDLDPLQQAWVGLERIAVVPDGVLVGGDNTSGMVDLDTGLLIDDVAGLPTAAGPVVCLGEPFSEAPNSCLTPDAAEAWSAAGRPANQWPRAAGQLTAEAGLRLNQLLPAGSPVLLTEDGVLTAHDPATGDPTWTAEVAAAAAVWAIGPDLVLVQDPESSSWKGFSATSGEPRPAVAGFDGDAKLLTITRDAAVLNSAGTLIGLSGTDGSRILSAPFASLSPTLDPTLPITALGADSGFVLGATVDDHLLLWVVPLRPEGTVP